MRLILLLIVLFTQLKEYQQYSYPKTYDDRSRNEGPMQQYHSHHQPTTREYTTDGEGYQNSFEPSRHQMPRNNFRASSGSMYEDDVPQRAFSRPNVVYLPPSQTNAPYQTQIKLLRNIGGYQLVHSGEPAELDYNQRSQLNRHQNIPRESQFIHGPAPPQNDYLEDHQRAQNYNEKSHVHISANPIENPDFYQQNHYQAPQNFNRNPPQWNTQSPYENYYPQPSQRNIPNDHLPVPSSNIYPFDRKYLTDFIPQMPDVPYFPQNYPLNLPHLPQSTLQHVPHSISPQYAPNDLPHQYGQNLQQDVPYQPPNFVNDGHQYIPNHDSQRISPYVPQYNSPDESSQYTQQRFPAYDTPHQQSGRTSEVTDDPYYIVKIPQFGNYQKPSGFEERQRGIHHHQPYPNGVALNNEGFQVVNEFESNQRGYNTYPHPTQPQSGHINEEGYQVINEGPVEHFVTIGMPTTQIISHNLPEVTSPSPVNTIQTFPISITEALPISKIDDQSNNKEIIQPNSNNTEHLQQDDDEVISDLTVNEQPEIAEHVPEPQESDNHQMPVLDAEVSEDIPREHASENNVVDDISEHSEE